MPKRVLFKPEQMLAKQRETEVKCKQGKDELCIFEMLKEESLHFYNKAVCADLSVTRAKGTHFRIWGVGVRWGLSGGI